MNVLLILVFMVRLVLMVLRGLIVNVQKDGKEPDVKKVSRRTYSSRPTLWVTINHNLESISLMLNQL